MAMATTTSTPQKSGTRDAAQEDRGGQEAERGGSASVGGGAGCAW